MAKPADQRSEKVEAGKDREGFFPFHTNAFDRVFIGVVILIGIHLLWLRFVEPALPIEAATVLSVVVGYYVVKKG